MEHPFIRGLTVLLAGVTLAGTAMVTPAAAVPVDVDSTPRPATTAEPTQQPSTEPSMPTPTSTETAAPLPTTSGTDPAPEQPSPVDEPDGLVDDGTAPPSPSNPTATPTSVQPLLVQSPAPASTVYSADGTVRFSGVGEPGATVSLVTGTGRIVVNTVVNSDGTWSASGWLSLQTYMLTTFHSPPGLATIMDMYTLTVTSAPQPLVVSTPVAGSPVVARDHAVSFAGTGHPGGRVVVSTAAGRPVIDVPVLASGTWSGTGTLAYQTYDLTVRHIVPGEADETRSLIVTVRSQADRTFAVTSPVEGSVVTSPSDSLTIEGTGIVGAHIGVARIAGGDIGETLVADDGRWTVVVPVTPGSHALRITQSLRGMTPQSVDLHVELSGSVVVQPFALVSPAQGARVIAPDSFVLFSGRGAAGARVTVLAGNGRVVIDTLVKDDGTWQATGALGWQVYTLDYEHTPGALGGERASGNVALSVVRA